MYIREEILKFKSPVEGIHVYILGGNNASRLSTTLGFNKKMKNTPTYSKWIFTIYI